MKHAVALLLLVIISGCDAPTERKGATSNSIYGYEWRAADEACATHDGLVFVQRIKFEEVLAGCVDHAALVTGVGVSNFRCSAETTKSCWD